jgi:hypothetical protein
MLIALFISAVPESLLPASSSGGIFLNGFCPRSENVGFFLAKVNS